MKKRNLIAVLMMTAALALDAVPRLRQPQQRLPRRKRPRQKQRRQKPPRARQLSLNRRKQRKKRNL